MFEDGLPRLLLLSGRNEEGVRQLIERMKNSIIDEEYAALLHSVFYKNMNAHHFKSFCFVPNQNEGAQEEIAVRATTIVLLFLLILSFTVSSSIDKTANMVHILWNGIAMEWYGETIIEHTHIRRVYA